MPDIAFRELVFARASSTNDLIKEAIRRNEPEGQVVRAYEQLSGHGRQRRKWVSPFGGVYLSMLLRPDTSYKNLSSIALVMSLSVRRALQQYEGAQDFAVNADAIKVKWPNDVVILHEAINGADPGDAAFGKVAGISNELISGALCIGIGINVYPSKEQDSPQALDGPKYRPAFLFKKGAVSKSEEKAVIDDISHELLEVISGDYFRWKESGFAGFLDEYNSCQALCGRVVQVEDRNGNLICEGKAMGADADGALLVRTTTGAINSFPSGEVHLL
ncbi:MAG: biotin--[acetyl-CoA-carboxylase] ligase [Eggerthellaceae bacterium]|nr:biotin--[acetyl-CoA-carboxylase] ligase [Eggerthellaceae bacterium]